MIGINQRYPAYKTKNELRNRQRREMERHLLPPHQISYRYRLAKGLYYDFLTWNYYVLQIEYPSGNTETIGPVQFFRSQGEYFYFGNIVIRKSKETAGDYPIILRVGHEADWDDLPVQLVPS
jgi:hypothetical protein